MQKLATGMTTKAKGFTLIEIMIVLIIIGITFGFALIAFGDFGANRRILLSAEQLANILKLAQQQAILEKSTLGLNINSDSYSILKLHKTQQWVALSQKGIFRTRYFPKNTVITFKSSKTMPTNTPAVIIYSSGDMTPFTLDVKNQNEWITSLSSTANGSLTFTKAKTQ